MKGRQGYVPIVPGILVQCINKRGVFWKADGATRNISWAQGNQENLLSSTHQVEITSLYLYTFSMICKPENYLWFLIKSNEHTISKTLIIKPPSVPSFSLMTSSCIQPKGLPKNIGGYVLLEIFTSFYTKNATFLTLIQFQTWHKNRHPIALHVPTLRSSQWLRLFAGWITLSIR